MGKALEQQEAPAQTCCPQHRSVRCAGHRPWDTLTGQPLCARYWQPLCAGSTLGPGAYPSWMNSSRAAHSDTSCGSPLLNTTKDKMGSRSSAPLQVATAAAELDLSGLGLAGSSPRSPQPVGTQLWLSDGDSVCRVGTGPVAAPPTPGCTDPKGTRVGWYRETSIHSSLAPQGRGAAHAGRLG